MSLVLAQAQAQALEVRQHLEVVTIRTLGSVQRVQLGAVQAVELGIEKVAAKEEMAAVAVVVEMVVLAMVGTVAEVVVKGSVTVEMAA